MESANSYLIFIALGYFSQVTLLIFLILLTLSYIKPALLPRLKTAILVLLLITVVGTVASLSRSGYVVWKLYSQQNFTRAGL